MGHCTVVIKTIVFVVFFPALKLRGSFTSLRHDVCVRVSVRACCTCMCVYFEETHVSMNKVSVTVKTRTIWNKRTSPPVSKSTYSDL